MPRQRNLYSDQTANCSIEEAIATLAPAIAVIALLRHLLVASSQLKSSDSQQSGEDNAIFALSVVKAAPQARAKTTWHAWICFERSDH